MVEMHIYSSSVRIKAPCSVVYDWHTATGALSCLTPPWMKCEVIETEEGIRNGKQVLLKIQRGPLHFTWMAEHRNVEPNKRFDDVQLRGPFASWHHKHEFSELPNGDCLLTDTIEYALPFGWLGAFVEGSFIENDLQNLFEYRHKKTVEEIEGQRK